MARSGKHTASCVCGGVQLEASGDPITRVVCYCDDCQAGSRQVAALPRAANPLGGDGGTDYLLFRKDRIRCVEGEVRLQRHKLSEGSATSRCVAACCNTFMFMAFDDAPALDAGVGREVRGGHLAGGDADLHPLRA